MYRPFVPAMAIPAAALALMVAGCNQTDAADNAQATAAAQAKAEKTAAAAAQFGDRVRALPEGQRNGVFLRAIRDGGQACQDITGQYEAAAVAGKPTWVVTCDKTKPWVISFGGNGIAIVSEMTQAAGLPRKAG